MDCSPPGSSVHGNLGKNTGVGSHALLQGIFPTQGLNPGLLHRQVGSSPLRHFQQKDFVKFTHIVLHVRTSPICVPGWSAIAQMYHSSFIHVMPVMSATVTDIHLFLLGLMGDAAVVTFLLVCLLACKSELPCWVYTWE